MVCCTCCCETKQGGTCCGEGDAATCCPAGQYCCDGACQAGPCEECVTDGDCVPPPGHAARCCDGVCKDTLNDAGACYKAATSFATCEMLLYDDCQRDDQSNQFDLCEVCPP
jgi:hypothetical protein